MYNTPIFMHSFMRSEQVHKTTAPHHLHALLHKPLPSPQKTKYCTIRKSLTNRYLPNLV